MTLRRRTLASGAVAGGALSALPAAAPTSSARARAPGQAAQPASVDQVTQPADGVIMPPGYVPAVAQAAYLWG